MFLFQLPRTIFAIQDEAPSWGGDDDDEEMEIDEEEEQQQNGATCTSPFVSKMHLLHNTLFRKPGKYP